jgi:hypothetical protein
MFYFSVISSRSKPNWINQLDLSKKTWATTIHHDDNINFIFANTSTPYFIDDIKTYKNVSGIENNNNEIYYEVPDLLPQSNINANVSYKTFLSIRDFLKTNYSFFVRVNTGSYLHLTKFRNYCLSKLPNYNLYAGVKGHAYNPNDKFYPHEKIEFCSGACFVISRDVAQKIWNNIEEYLPLLKHQIEYPDDVLIGKIVRHILQVPIIELPRIVVYSSNFYFDKNISHYYFANKINSIEENWYSYIHERFKNENIIY